MRHFRMYGAPVREEDKRPITRSTVGRVVRIFRPYRGKVSVVGLAIVITSALGVVNPLLIVKVFNNALFGSPLGSNDCAGRLCPNLQSQDCLALDFSHAWRGIA